MLHMTLLPGSQVVDASHKNTTFSRPSTHRVGLIIAEGQPAVFYALMKESPSERIVDQRIRNRIMEAVHTRADGDEGVRRESPAEYFESFYDWIPHHGDGEMRPNTAITSEEREQLSKVSAILDEACDATPGNMDADEFIATGWPKRVQPVAQRTLELLLARGRFDEGQDEEDRSNTNPWP